MNRERPAYGRASGRDQMSKHRRKPISIRGQATANEHEATSDSIPHLKRAGLGTDDITSSAKAEVGDLSLLYVASTLVHLPQLLLV